MIEPLCKNQNVLVVGSGPNHIACGDFDGKVIGANGGAYLYSAAVGRECNILCTTSHLFRDDVTRQEFETRRSLISRRFHSIWLDTKNGTFAQTVKRLRQFNIHWVDAYDCNPDRRKEIVQGACGVDLWVSTGVFAICLAVYSGAKTVRTNGISLQDGHFGETVTERMHRNEDRQCLSLLQDEYAGLILQDSLAGML